MIHVVHTIASGGFYGAEKVVLDLMSMQRMRSDAATTLIDFVDPGMEASELGRRVRALGGRVESFPSPIHPRTLWEYGALMRSLKPTLIHSHGYKPTFVHLATRYLHRLPLVITSHGWALGPLRRDRWYSALDYWQLPFADRVVAVSAEWGAALKRRNAKIRPHIILNGIDTRVRVRGTRPLRRYLSLPPEDQTPIIGSVGRLVAFKNHAALIEAVARIQGDFPCRLAIIGDGPLRGDLEALWRSKMPEIAPALIPFQSDILEWMADMDIFCMPSLEGEGLPMALLEAGLLERAVVCANSGGIGALIDGENGRLVPMRDQLGLERALRELLATADLRMSLGSRLRHTVLERHDMRRTEDEYWELYQSALRSRQSAA